jgi:hypothetical protein
MTVLHICRRTSVAVTHPTGVAGSDMNFEAGGAAESRLATRIRALEDSFIVRNFLMVLQGALGGERLPASWPRTRSSILVIDRTRGLKIRAIFKSSISIICINKYNIIIDIGY